MSDSYNIAAMQRELGHQLAALRRQAGLTQHGLAALAGFSRSTVSLAEIGRQSQAREFWEACDKALDTGGVLAAGMDQIDAVRDAEQRAAACAAQEAREARALAALTAAQRHSGVTAGVTRSRHARTAVAKSGFSSPSSPKPPRRRRQCRSSAEYPAEPITAGKAIMGRAPASAVVLCFRKNLAGRAGELL